MRRVVVTGLGLVTPLATGVEETWARLLNGQPGAGPITRFDASGWACQVACEIKRGDGSDGTFCADQWLEPRDQRRYDDFILYASRPLRPWSTPAPKCECNRSFVYATRFLGTHSRQAIRRIPDRERSSSGG
jgi:hypothetical protein